MKCLAGAIEIARARGDAAHECALWVNTGAAHCYAARYAEALACVERALEFPGQDDPIPSSCRAALINIALCALHLNDIGRGFRAIQEFLQDAEAPTSVGDLLHRALLEHQHVRLLLQAGLVEQARERAQLARKFAAPSGAARAGIAAAIAEALTEIHAGAAEVGLARLRRSLERARIDLPSFLPDALAALIKGYEVAGQPDAALVYLRELKRLHQDGREAQVLMHHAQHVARVDAELDLRGRGALAAQQSRLRGQLSERDIVRARVAMLEQHSVAAELHDDTTGEHCYRVGRLASLLARPYGVDDHTCFLIDLAARMHDIGKLTVPDAILLKPGRLTPEERAIMETHTTAGAALLAKSNIPQMYVAEEIARHHHERYDGTGYPMR
ncbi:MAG: HD domain-containing protein, partial [Burkholderiaceae bacterium]|nr:HD domain-containing protein [Burkholderiaceae bacterium]